MPSPSSISCRPRLEGRSTGKPPCLNRHAKRIDFRSPELTSFWRQRLPDLVAAHLHDFVRPSIQDRAIQQVPLTRPSCRCTTTPQFLLRANLILNRHLSVARTLRKIHRANVERFFVESIAAAVEQQHRPCRELLLRPRNTSGAIHSK